MASINNNKRSNQHDDNNNNNNKKSKLEPTGPLINDPSPAATGTTMVDGNNENNNTNVMINSGSSKNDFDDVWNKL